jgi:predicted flavoprotein YhiN
LHALTFENTYITWSDISKKDLNKLALNLCAYPMKVDGKSTFKDEFVTAGGVNLKEVDFKTMESKIIPGLYFAGEVLNIDALTGGFNFQAAWSEAWVIAQSV